MDVEIYGAASDIGPSFKNRFDFSVGYPPSGAVSGGCAGTSGLPQAFAISERNISSVENGRTISGDLL